jgi:hypothetical protein
LLKLCCVPPYLLAFLSFFAAATINTNKTNKAGSTCH